MALGVRHKTFGVSFRVEEPAFSMRHEPFAYFCVTVSVPCPTTAVSMWEVSLNVLSMPTF